MRQAHVVAVGMLKEFLASIVYFEMHRSMRFGRSTNSVDASFSMACIIHFGLIRSGRTAFCCRLWSPFRLPHAADPHFATCSGESGRGDKRRPGLALGVTNLADQM